LVWTPLLYRILSVYALSFFHEKMLEPLFPLTPTFIVEPFFAPIPSIYVTADILDNEQSVTYFSIFLSTFL